MKTAMIILALIISASSAFASTAGCEGKVNGRRLSFLAKGSLSNRANGMGYVKIDNRLVASFDGDAASIRYLSRTFSIRNSRGDVVEGKLNNILTGASTLRRLSLPGEGIELRNVPVKCWFQNR
jgi:hypothetical protein